MKLNSNNVFQGKLIRLRSLEVEDADLLLKQLQDSEIMRLDSNIQWPRSIAKIRSIIEKDNQKDESDNKILVIETLEGRMIGGVNTQLADARNGTFSIGLGLAERNTWGRGYAKEAMLLVLRHMFHERRYQKCNIGVYSFNKRAIGFYHHLGFQDEGCIRRNYFSNGRYYDELLMGMTREEFDSLYADFRIVVNKNK